MAGFTVVEKIISAHAGAPARRGDVVVATVDVAMALDASGPLTLDYFEQMGGTAVFDPAKVVMVMDHYTPCPSADMARLQDKVRAFHRQGMCTLFDLGEGICHHVLPERGYVKPGRIVVGADSHTISHGAFNCMGAGLGSSDVAAAMISGKVWLRVPGTIRVTLSGRLRPGVQAKDLALWLTRTVGGSGAAYKAIEFTGPGVAELSIYERMTVCNMMAETGAKAAIMPCDGVLQSRFPGERLEAVSPDADAEYEREIAVDLGALDVMIARPHRPDDVVPVGEVAGLPIHMGVIGTCTNSSLEDLQSALAVMGGRRVAPGFELLLVPATRNIYAEAARLGLLEKFVRQGAYVLPPGCGPCCGSSAGIPSDGEPR
jgi:3-isopropylmalate/(R)-2-methylmalate dehydratase large subunit